MDGQSAEQKTCKYCAMSVPLVAQICPFCRKRLIWPHSYKMAAVVVPVCLILLIIVILMVHYDVEQAKYRRLASAGVLGPYAFYDVCVAIQGDADGRCTTNTISRFRSPGEAVDAISLWNEKHPVNKR